MVIDDDSGILEGAALQLTVRELADMLARPPCLSLVVIGYDVDCRVQATTLATRRVRIWQRTCVLMQTAAAPCPRPAQPLMNDDNTQI